MQIPRIRRPSLGGALVAVPISLLALRQLSRKLRSIELNGKVALITGGSRGLGLILARQFAAGGARVVICARNEAELSRARLDLESRGARVLAVRCDVSDADDVSHLIGETLREFGRIDIVVNNAGIIQVGPFETMAREDYENAMDAMFWGTFNVTLGALPHLARGSRVVNITSIGAAVAVPHLLPYSAAKFATKGFSEGLHAEAARFGVRVVTILPGLMRTGSFLNALFKGRREAELQWFAIGSTLPLLTLDAERAAARIVKACRRGETLVTLGLPARILRLFHALLPGLTADLLALVNRVLPHPTPASTYNPAEPGKLHRTALSSPPFTELGDRAAHKFNEAA